MLKKSQTKKSSNRLIALTLACGSVALPQTAQAISVGGGEWNYGTDAVAVWSNYNHPTRTHMAWVKTLVDYRETGAIRPGTEAGVNLRATLWGNQAGWGVF